MNRELLVGDRLRATLSLPDEPARAGLIVLHPSNSASRDFPLAVHLATVLPGRGVAVLRHDRRAPRTPGDDVPLRLQALDARAAIDELRAATAPGLPVVVWGYSQGAWAALLVARDVPVAGVVLVGASGVSPAAQMRYAAERRVREAGFGDAAVAAMLEIRRLCEGTVAGESAEHAQRMLDAAAREPWFAHALLSPIVEPCEPEDDFEGDFEPAPLIRGLSCPLLAVVGDDDRWVPLAESVAVLETALDCALLHVGRGDHGPTADGYGTGPILPGYERGLFDWIERRVLRVA